MDTEKVILNAKIVDAAKAAVSVTDSSYLYGIGLFETMRAVGRKGVSPGRSSGKAE